MKDEPYEASKRPQFAPGVFLVPNNTSVYVTVRTFLILLLYFYYFYTVIYTCQLIPKRITIFCGYYRSQGDCFGSPNLTWCDAPGIATMRATGIVRKLF